MIDHYSSHPLYSSVFPPAAVRAIHAIWAERHAWLDCIEALPQTFSHLDAFTRNIFLRPGPDDDLAVGLIDWGFSGVAAVGEEIAPLVAASIAFSDLAHIAPDALDRAVFAGYLEGLRDAGWTGDEVLVRAAYTGSIALRYGVGPQRAFLPMLLDERYHPFLEELFGVPIADFGKRYASRGEWILGLADEFRLLLPSLEPTMPGAA